MSHSINAPIGYCGSNSLSPEPCALSPRLTHASYLTEEPVDNPLPAANAASTLDAGCDAFGESGRWLA